MSAKVHLAHIVDGIESQSYDFLVFVHQKAGSIHHILSEFLTDAEDGKSHDGLYEWQQEELALAYDMVEHEDAYIQLPTEFDIHEYEMMEDFCFTLQNKETQDKLLQSIRGKGAFRRFKDKIIVLDVEEEWFDYRDKCYKEIAIEFCEDHNLEYHNDIEGA